MTIDEAIKYLNTHGSLDNRNAEDREAVQKLINTVMWYRKQDLIRRDDIPIGEILAAFGGFEDMRPVIMKIPKAEPPHHIGKVTEMVNGDCETCKHYIEQQRLSYDCQECIEMGMKDYEPYIPKENE